MKYFQYHTNTSKVAIGSCNNGKCKHCVSYTHTHSDTHTCTHSCSHTYTHINSLCGVFLFLSLSLSLSLSLTHTHTHTHTHTNTHTHSTWTVQTRPGDVQTRAALISVPQSGTEQGRERERGAERE